jgi:nitronate monooxygenase
MQSGCRFETGNLLHNWRIQDEAMQDGRLKPVGTAILACGEVSACKGSGMMIKTRITEMFGIEAPILMGGMTGVGYGPLVAAVANGGGLGFITAHMFPTAEALEAEIKRTREATDKPFGVNLTILPAFNPIPYDEYRRVIIENKIPVVETAGRNPSEHMADFKANGVKVIHKCTSVRHAVSAEKLGVDVISIDGFECAGHPGEDDIGLVVLLPATVDAVSIPVIASGGMADGRGLAAALMLGAEGANMGTRFVATKEAKVHENVKRQIVANTERDTVLTNRILRNTARVARNAVSEEVALIQRDATKTIEDVRHLVSGARGRANVLEKGEMDGGIWSAGQTQGLIHDIPTVAEAIQNIMQQTVRTLRRNADRVIG